MLRHVLLLATMLCATLTSDLILSHHCSELVESGPNSTYLRMAAGVEKPLHMFHNFEYYAICVAGLLMFTLFFVHSPRGQANCGKWIASEPLVWGLQMFWILALVATMLVGVISALFEGIAQGYEQQGGLHIGLFSGFGAEVLLEFITILAGLVCLIMGSPGGWSGQDEPTWL